MKGRNSAYLHGTNLLRNQCQSKLVMAEKMYVFCSSKSTAPIKKRLMIPSLQRGGTFFQPITITDKLIFGCFPVVQSQIDSKS